MANTTLQSMPVTVLSGVGAKMAERLTKLNISSVQDLLFHLPYRYEDRTKVYPIASLHAGLWTAIEAEIISSEVQFGRRKILSVKVSDGNGSLMLKFFNFNAGMKNGFTEGKHIHAYGEIKRGYAGLEIIHPEYYFVGQHQPANASTPSTLTPVYSTTEGLKQNTLRDLVKQALDLLTPNNLPELLPQQLYTNQLSLKEALFALHLPNAETNLEQLEQRVHPAQQRLIIEELLAHNLSMLALKQKKQQEPSVPIHTNGQLKQQFLQTLPFSPTNAQQRVVSEIETDLTKTHPMMRLVQGDVGSGKTLVALLSALQVIEAGYQVALMAPTEILAEQHLLNFQQWLTPFNIEIAWLAGKVTGKAKTEQIEKIASGQAKMVIGTHALFQEQVVFSNLALVIIDEQHRFGVQQRLSLREKGTQQGFTPHQLIMTATPIPRTLAMTAYADLDTSVIDELPPGRTAIKTIALPDSRRDEVIQRIYSACQTNKQAYWVCTLIDESQAIEAQAAADIADELKQRLPDLSIGLVHGRMKAAEKQEVMDAFKNNQIHLLVATTVIEVGVDVPNASLMIIENPERLGLAQLHQLRGRVGRGPVASHCVLLYHSPLSTTAQKRLGVLRESNDGFYISQQDLEIRGPGEVLGTKQTGVVELKIADLLMDAHHISFVQQLALQIHQHHPQEAKGIILRWLAQRESFSKA